MGYTTPTPLELSEELRVKVTSLKGVRADESIVAPTVERIKELCAKLVAAEVSSTIERGWVATSLNVICAVPLDPAVVALFCAELDQVVEKFRR